MLFTAVFAAAAISTTAPVYADGAGAFIGGVAAARIGQSIRDRNDYEEDQAYYAQQQAAAAQQQAANSDSSSAEGKLKQLDSMRRQGLITDAEYNAKKKEILANM